MARKYAAVRDETRNVSLATNAELANTMWKLLVGLMPYRSLLPGEGMVLPRTGSIHTSFLRFPIDVVFLDARGKVVGARRRVRPFRVALAPRGTRTAIELPAGVVEETRLAVGDIVVIIPATEESGK